MKAQELFDKSIAALLKQRKRSVKRTTEGTTCSYRSKVGCCAVGHLIPDDKYNEQMDRFGGLNSDGLLRNYPELKKYLLASDITELEAKDLLNDMQYVHDTVHPNAWKKNFKEVAERYSLNWNFN